MNMSFKMLMVLWLISIQYSLAQSDSVIFVNAPWRETQIARGVTWRTVHFDSSLFHSSQNINVLSVKTRKCKCVFRIGYEKEKLKSTSQFGKEANAIGAVNGTFFDLKKGGSVDYLRAAGEVINKNIYAHPPVRGVHQKAALVMKKGSLEILEWDRSDTWEEKISGEDVMVSGPLLMYKFNAQKLDSSSFTKTRHPRTFIVTKPGETLLITVDGRHENANGMSLYELTKIAQWLGATDALNLDGGGSTTMWIYNQPENGVVNYPSDNMKWDHKGERGVANVLLVMQKK